MSESTYSISDLSERMDLGTAGHRALREAARFGALGEPVGISGRAHLWAADATYRAALFLTLHTRLGFSAPTAAEMVKTTPGIDEAIEAIQRGGRWRFEIQHLSREELPHCAFAPWEAARTGLHTGEPPIARTVIDLRMAWGWISE